MNIVAHEDDDLLFLNPDIAQDIQAGLCARTVFVTAGNANEGQDYWQSRELGIRAAYSTMAGVANTWIAAEAGIAGFPLQVWTLAGKPTVSLIFMHLPDGFGDGSGGSNNFYESLQKLWQGSISQIHTVDGLSIYTRADLVATLSALMTAFQPQLIRAQDYLGTYGDGDHSDHHSVAYLVRRAHAAYATIHVLVAYEDYSIDSRPENVFGADYTAKANAWSAYAWYDDKPCGHPPVCGSNSYSMWQSRRYTLAFEVGGGALGSPNLALAGTATASSSELAEFDPTKANDGNTSTRWSSSYADNQWWQVDFGSLQTVDTVVVNWETAYASTYEVQTSTDGITFRTAAVVTAGSAGVQRAIFAPVSARYVRILCVTRATHWGFSFWEAAVYGPTTNLALGALATASSSELAEFDPTKADDGNPSTRWSSSYADNQWWQVDLGSPQYVDTVVVNWETAYASTYEVQTSIDGVTFQTAAAVTAGSAGVQRASFAPVTARYVRILCLTRATQWGFSFWEAAVYGPN